MTGQVFDKFIFKGEEFSLLSVQGGELFLPENFGMKPVMLHTACYRGFYTTYEFIDNSIFLRKLTIKDKNENYPIIDGIKPEKILFGLVTEYNCLNVEIAFSGIIMLANDFIHELYEHMGFQKATSFRKVLVVTIKDSQIVKVKDCSRVIEQERKILEKQKKFTLEMMSKWIE